MIVKNGEILAIDHIAHDNTLSGNGTSAKPVGLSQSTKDLIDSKVKKTDFETYKSSAANQISNINTKITTDESNFESYKSSAANQINTINNKIAADEADFNSYKSSAHNEIANQVSILNGKITDVANAKQDKGNYVSATNFDDFKNTVESQIEALDTGKQPVGDYVVTSEFNSYKETVNGKFTTVNERITDVDAAKQDKGDYVSASDFNTYKTNVAGEITRVDGRIDATNTNLENNYYKKSQTYSQSEVDEIVAKLGAYVYVEDVNPDGSPNVDEPSSKVIYLTQIPNETQCLQWIWLETQEWKCIGDTTMDLSAYATKEWTNDNFETIDHFNTTIANYYTKDNVDIKLATKVDNDDFNAYKNEANGKFATKQNLTDTKAELEDTIESVSGEIISKVNTDYGMLDGKIDAIANTLSNDYYTSLEIDAILAASGEYYTKSESDTKYAEKSVFETAINELNSNKLDKSATANWDVTEYTEGENIKIVGHEISGKDWSDEIAAAVENKVDKSELENYYTSNQIDNKFVTNDDFNNLDNDVDAIDADLDTLSGKTVTVIKDSETVKAIRSTEPDGTISYTLSAHDGKQADYLWKPTVNDAGDISWELALTGDTPTTANIKGSDGDNGKTPELTSENYHIKWKYTDESIWNDLGDFRGASGADGKDGKDGINGTSAFVRINPNTNCWEISNDNKTWTSTDVSATGPQGEEGHDGDPGFSPTVDAVAITDGEKTGTEITFTYKDAQGQTQTTVYSAWNGVNGEGATVHFDGIDGIKITPVDTTHFNVGLSADYKTQVEAVSGKQDALTQSQLDYIDAVPVLSAASASWNDKLNASTFNTYTATTAPAAFQPKGDYATTQDISDMATQTWVGDQGFLKNSALTDYATKSYANEASANALSQAESWVETEGYLKSVSVATNSSIDGTGTTNNPLLLKTSAENALKDVANKANTADVYSKTAADDKFVTSGDITPDTDYVMTTTGWKVLSLPGGGMTQVTHDTTLTGQGNADDSKLGVAWSALSGNTIASALSAGSATVAANLGTSSFADITGAINAKADATAISDMLTKTDAASTYQTKAGMSDYLTTSDASTTYQPKGNYASASDITDMATKTWVGQQGYLTSIPDSYATKTYANEASANAYDKAVAQIPTVTGFITKDVDNLTYYYKKTETSGANELTTEFAKYVSTGDIITAANNTLTGIKIGNTSYTVPTTDLSNYYTKSETSATGELNTEFAKKLDSTIAASTYQTKADMSAYVAVTGDQMTGELELVGSNYDDYYMKATRTGVNGHARFGMGENGGAVIKANDGTNNAQMVLKANATSGIEIVLQHNSNQTIGNVIPMVVETAGWVPTGNDYKLHIVLDS